MQKNSLYSDTMPYSSRYQFAFLFRLSDSFYCYGMALIIICAAVSCRTMSTKIPKDIMGSGTMSKTELVLFFLSQNASIDKERIHRIAGYYIEEARIESVNADIAFAQMCLETGFLRFGGLVTPEMNNFCGLGAVNTEKRGYVFENERIGIRAHIQHLKAYASAEPLRMPCVDPRYLYVIPHGKAPDIQSLTGSWASDPLYGTKIKNILIRMYAR